MSHLWKPPTLAEWMDQVSPEIEWLIPELIPRDALVFVTGQQKLACKTWLALLISLCISRNLQRGLIRPSQADPILFIEEEGAKSQTRERISKLCLGLGIDYTTLDNIYFAHRDRVKLDEEVWRQKLLEAVDQIKPAMVVFDALSYLHKGEENSMEAMSQVMDTLSVIRSKGPTVMVLAHLNKADGKNPKADIDQQIRGASIISNVYDVHIALRCYNKSDPAIKMTVRSRDWVERNLEISWEIDETPGGTATYSLTESYADVQTFERLVKKCLTATKPRATYTNMELEKLWNLNATEAKRVVTTLEGQQLVIKETTGWFFGEPSATKE